MNKLATLLATTMALGSNLRSGLTSQIIPNTSSLKNRIHRSAGSKLAKKASKGAVSLSHGPGGIVAQAVREMARDKWLANRANR